MPYQDIDDEETRPAQRQPTRLERWTKKILIEDWSLKLLAAAVTVALWMAVTGQNQPIRQRVPVQLHFIRPAGMEISSDLPSNIEVVLKGSQSKLSAIGQQLVGTVDLANQQTGERVVRLQDKVQLMLPPEVTVEGFKPATVSVKLQPVVESEVEVEVKLEGKPPEGYEFAGITTNPSRVRLRGPADRLQDLRKVTTESISLDGRKETFSLPNVAVSVPDPKIELLDLTVDIRVEIVEKNRRDVQRRFASEHSTLFAAITPLLRIP
jgi:YbbR domain-containing protein